jgi:mono/diheme cytochrome c family protein
MNAFSAYVRLLLTSLVLLMQTANAHDVFTTKLTWSREISRIFYRSCAGCHREGGAAPMPLVRFEETRPWAEAIKEEVLNRRMPPWNAVKGFGEFKNDPSLTQEEISLIAAWVEGGAPEGDPQLLPTGPHIHDAAPPMAGKPKRRIVRSGSVLPSGLSVLAVTPHQLGGGASVKVAALRPDGTFEPLLWILRQDPKLRRTYEFAAPVALPKGTRILMFPPTEASFELLSK